MTAGPHRSRWQSTANSQGHISAIFSGARARGSLASQVAKASLLDLRLRALISGQFTRLPGEYQEAPAGLKEGGLGKPSL